MPSYEPAQASIFAVPYWNGGLMIYASNLMKLYPSPSGAKRVLDGVSFSIAKGEKLAVLGRNGAGKSTLVRILAGIEQPTSGSVVRRMSMSWPLGLAGGFSGSMTGYDCGRFVSRIYGRDWKQLRDFLEEFSELGPYLAMPIKAYSTGMRARLAFGISLAIDFDCYLVDEIISVGDRRFQKKSFDELFGRRNHKAMIIVSHNLEVVQEFCSAVLVLKNGKGRVFHDKRKAFDIYATL